MADASEATTAARAVTAGFCIGIITSRRPERLASMLASLAAVTDLPNHASSVLVIDNHSSPTSESAVEAAALPVPVRYVHEPRRGYATARNAAITHRPAGTDLAFLDDDQEIDSHWAQSMAHARAQFPRDLIAGRQEYSYDGWRQPQWQHNAAPGATVDFTRGTAGNLLVPSWLLDDTHLKFDTAFDTTGGEDTEFLLRATDAGALIRWCPEALVRESGDADRDGHDRFLERLERDAATYARLMRRERRRRARVLGSGLARSATAPMLVAVLRGDRQSRARESLAVGHGLLTGLLRRP